MSVTALRSHFSARVPAHAGAGLRVREINPPTGVKIAVSGSKSFTNRALVLAGLNPTPLALEGVLFSDDSYWGIDCLERLGFEVDLNVDARTALISPPRALNPKASLAAQHGREDALDLHFGMAGTLARFFPAVVLNFQRTYPNLGAIRVRAGGERRLCERPLSELMRALRQLGAKVIEDGLPAILESSPLAGRCTVSGAKSGQFLSGLLIAAAGARSPIRIERVDNLVQPDYVRMTIAALKAFGADIEHDDALTRFKIDAPGGLRSDRYAIEADASTACYFLAFAVLRNFELTVTNLGSSTLQPDLGFVSFLERMGARITVTPSSVTVHARPPGPLKGGFHVDFSALSDQSLTAGVLALCADGPIEVSGVEHIRKHESDRIACLVANLAGLGVECEERPDGFKVFPPGRPLSGAWPTHHDHRFGMAGFLVACMHRGVEILEPACVEKTAPDFFVECARLGVAFE